MDARLAPRQAEALRAHEEVFAYWRSRRCGGRLPARRDIDPEGFKRWLPMISLIDVDADAFRVRLAGTGLWPLYGGEITGRRLDEIYTPRDLDYWTTEYRRVVELRRPCAGVHSLHRPDAPRAVMAWLRLPLSSDGERVDMILGYDAVLTGLDSRPSGVRAA